MHAEENRVLSSHGPFNSKSVHPTADARTERHLANMESMAEEVKNAFDKGRSVIKNSLKNSCLFEKRQSDTTPSVYEAKSTEILNCLHLYWDDHFQGEYLRDHKHIQNDLVDVRTAWTDKYMTTIYTASDGSQGPELQLMPDYLRWLKKPANYTTLLAGAWDEIPPTFLPSKKQSHS